MTEECPGPTTAHRNMFENPHGCSGPRRAPTRGQKLAEFQKHVFSALSWIFGGRSGPVGPDRRGRAKPSVEKYDHVGTSIRSGRTHLAWAGTPASPMVPRCSTSWDRIRVLGRATSDKCSRAFCTTLSSLLKKDQGCKVGFRKVSQLSGYPVARPSSSANAKFPTCWSSRLGRQDMVRECVIILGFCLQFLRCARLRCRGWRPLAPPPPCPQRACKSLPRKQTRTPWTPRT